MAPESPANGKLSIVIRIVSGLLTIQELIVHMVGAYRSKQLPKVGYSTPFGRSSRVRLCLLFVEHRLRSRVAAFRSSLPRPPNRPDLPCLFSSAEELIATVGLKPRNVDSLGHVEALKNFSGLRIDSP
jgi:hypothetical protein